jgi:hypothetical protein
MIEQFVQTSNHTIYVILAYFGLLILFLIPIIFLILQEKRVDDLEKRQKNSQISNVFV